MAKSSRKPCKKKHLLQCYSHNFTNELITAKASQKQIASKTAASRPHRQDQEAQSNRGQVHRIGQGEPGHDQGE